ncbi:MAG: FHA domain-containing protein [Lachnospiraceae bacterium]|nr:FHA domain-containing protein [Lachnospiraceae bacterium]
MKFKAKAKDCQIVIRAKTSFGENIDSKELDRFSRVFLRGFLKPKQIKKGIVDYTGPVGISLYERMKKPITKRDFLFIMEQIVVAVQKLQANSLSLVHLEKNIQYVYINETTKEVQFIYLPMVKVRNTGDLITFIDSIIYSVLPADENASEVVSRFVYYFHGLKPFDINKLEAFIQKEDRSVVNTIKKQNAGQSGYMTNKQQHYYEHYDNKDDEKTGLLDDEATGMLEGNEGRTVLEGATGVTYLLPDYEEATGLLTGEEATGLLADEEATGLLNGYGMQAAQVEKQEICYATLYRVLTNETIKINKPVFRIGKERSYVDYFVTNNTAVSRNHADIVMRAGKFYVKDLNSKNHTYINGREIPVQIETEILNGDRLTLGNEEFIFKY